MDMNLGRNRRAEPSDSDIERDVAELRRLLAGVEGPQEPHPAYWQNFVVRVRSRIDEQGAAKKRWSFSTAWASVGAAALVTVAVVSGIFSPEQPAVTNTGGSLPGPAPVVQPLERSAPGGDLAADYRASDASSLVLSGDDVRLISAIVSDDNDDDAIFEALVDSNEL